MHTRSCLVKARGSVTIYIYGGREIAGIAKNADLCKTCFESFFLTTAVLLGKAWCRLFFLILRTHSSSVLSGVIRSSFSLLSDGTGQSSGLSVCTSSSAVLYHSEMQSWSALSVLALHASTLFKYGAVHRLFCV